MVNFIASNFFAKGKAMPVPTTVLAALNGVALAETATVPPDTETLALCQQMLFDGYGIPASYLGASTSGTQVLKNAGYLTQYVNNTADTYTQLNAQVATPPKNIGM